MDSETILLLLVLELSPTVFSLKTIFDISIYYINRALFQMVVFIYQVRPLKNHGGKEFTLLTQETSYLSS